MIQASDLSRIKIRIKVPSTGRWENVSLADLTDTEFGAWVYKHWPEMLQISGGQWSTEKRVLFCNALEMKQGGRLLQDGQVNY